MSSKALNSDNSNQFDIMPFVGNSFTCDVFSENSDGLNKYESMIKGFSPTNNMENKKRSLFSPLKAFDAVSGFVKKVADENMIDAIIANQNNPAKADLLEKKVAENVEIGQDVNQAINNKKLAKKPKI